jgi:hypothetical protein
VIPRLGHCSSGHGGIGGIDGSFAFADPDRRLDFGYVLNRICPPRREPVLPVRADRGGYDSLSDSLG